MNVLTCAARGSRLPEPLRLLPEVPPRPEYDGLENPDGSRHAPSTLPRGAYAVDPEPCGAPYVPHPDPAWCGGAHPGDVRTGDPDGPGCLMSAGPRDTWVAHPEDARGRLSACRGRPGREGPNEGCAECGTAVATRYSHCYGPYQTHFLPDAVRVEPVV